MECVFLSTEERVGCLDRELSYVSLQSALNIHTPQQEAMANGR